MRTYTCTVETAGKNDERIEAIYKGFDRNFQDCDRIVLVNADGEYELYALDEGDEPLKELRKYLDDTWGCDGYIFFGDFERRKV